MHGCYRPLFLFIQDGEFSWDLKAQGLVFGSFFWGYIAMHLPGGLLAERFGGRNVFGVGNLLMGFFSILTPIAARSSYSALIVVRTLTGASAVIYTYQQRRSSLLEYISHANHMHEYSRRQIGPQLLLGNNNELAKQYNQKPIEASTPISTCTESPLYKS